MQSDKEYIRQLYLLQITTGELTETEQQELEEALHEPAIREMCDELDKQYQSVEMQQLLRERTSESRWNDLLAEIDEQPVFLMSAQRWTAAAAILLLVGLGGYLLWSKDKSSSAVLASNRPSTYDVRLRLATGADVVLSGPRAEQTITIGTAQLINKNGQLSYQKGSAEGWNILQVPAMKDYRVVLEDGTEVWLNSSSTLRFPASFNGDRREVEISGEGYFKVAKHASKPFTVRTPDGKKIEVLGTSFNINTYEPGKVTASLVDGSVKAVYGNRETLLVPGEEAVMQEGKEIAVQPFASESLLSWMDGAYAFKDMEFKTIARALARWYDIKVVFDSPEVEHYRFFGTLKKNRPLEEFMEMLQLAKGFHYRLEGSVLHVR